MTASIENIVQHLFHQPTLQSVSVDELQQMTQEYPSFAAARFLLLKKMQDSGHPDFTSQLHKTAIYFNNPLWLQLLLLPQKEAFIGRQSTNGHAIPPELPHVEPEQAQEPEPVTQQEPVIQEVPDLRGDSQEAEAGDAPLELQPQQLPVAQDQDSLVQEVLDRLRGNIREAGDTPQAPMVQEVLDRLRGHIREAGDTPQAPLVQEILNRLRGHIQEADNIPQEQQEPVIQQESYEQPGQQETETPLPDPVPAEIQEDILPPVSAGEATGEMHETLVQDTSPVDIHIPAEIAAQEDQPKEEDFAPFPDTEHTQPTPAEPVQPPAEWQPIFKTIIETPSAQHDLLFEPYHTIDYFASLGIRLDKVEPNPQDKLGKQLKSFTEWLKSMKKLPQASIEKALGENEESAVVAAASHSVVGKDIITEAMAEVFEKQGLNDKAAEVYRKLSLLNPSKSAYFASRINALKQ